MAARIDIVLVTGVSNPEADIIALRVVSGADLDLIFHEQFSVSDLASDFRI